MENNSENDDHAFNDREMVKKKERAINKTERKREIRDAVNNGRSDDSYTDSQRLSKIEKKIVDAENIVDDLSEDSLQLARRVVNLGRTVNKEEERLLDFNNRIGRMEENAIQVEEDADRFEQKHDRTWELRRNKIVLILMGLALLTSVIAILIPILTKGRL